MKDKPIILLVEDNLVVAQTCQVFLSDEPIQLIHVTTGTAAFEYLQETTPNVILLDLGLPDMNGMDILKDIQQRRLNSGVIIISAQTSVNVVVEVMRNGVLDYVEKPFTQERLVLALHNALRLPQLYQGIDSYQKINHSHYHGLVGVSKPMQTLYQIISTVATSKAPIFISGESGTGKELCAAAIYKESKRKNKSFIVLNCAAISKDLIESELFGHVKGAFTGAVSHRDGAAKTADGGTLFLDEIGEMDISLQSTLLRFVQTGQLKKVGSDKEEQADVRLVSATNRDISTEIKAGRFREDLYYRLNVINLRMPALRIRGDDILMLAEYFLNYYILQEGKSFERFTSEAEQMLMNYDWPGNVRQLQNIIQRLVVLNNAQMVTADMLSILLGETENKFENEKFADNSPTPLSANAIRPLWRVEEEIIEQAIELTNGNVLEAARRLEISPSTIYRKLKNWKKQIKRTVQHSIT